MNIPQFTDYRLLITDYSGEVAKDLIALSFRAGKGMGREVWALAPLIKGPAGIVWLKPKDTYPFSCWLKPNGN
ncbi:MAG: hypothetical protein WD426_10965 [Anditalea sp.]